MKRALLFAALAAGAMVSAESALGASFTYHGVLQDADKPAQGRYDIQLTLYSSPNGNTIVGGPLTLYGVDVREGSFSTDADFGPLAKSFEHAYVGVKVRSAGAGDFTTLDNLQAVTETNTSCPGSWSLDGNAGNPTGSYIGTADTKDLLLKSGAVTVFQAPAAIGAVALSGAAVAGAGVESTAVSFANTAIGKYSFAGGYEGGTTNEGSFVWGDHQIPYHAITDSGPNQFIVQAKGGVAINGTPPFNGEQFSVYSGPGQSYVEEYFAQTDYSGSVALDFGGVTNAGDYPTMNVTQNNGTTGKELLDIGEKDATLTVYPASSAQNYVLGSIKLSDQFVDSWVTLTGYGSTNTPNSKPGFIISTRASSFLTYQNATFNYKNISFNGGSFGLTTALGVGSDSTDGNGAYLTVGGVWTNASSRTFKEGFAHVDALGVLNKLASIPVQTWFYKDDHDEGRHMGPVAEDFAEAFGLGNDEKHIGTVDENGVAFAAIQGLNQKLETENSELRSKLENVLARLEKLEAGKEK